MTQVISIKEVKEVVTLPDGEYHGFWGGYLVRIETHDKVYELKTENGIRGINVPCVVKSYNGKVVVCEL